MFFYCMTTSQMISTVSVWNVFLCPECWYWQRRHSRFGQGDYRAVCYINIFIICDVIPYSFRYRCWIPAESTLIISDGTNYWISVYTTLSTAPNCWQSFSKSLYLVTCTGWHLPGVAKLWKRLTTMKKTTCKFRLFHLLLAWSWSWSVTTCSWVTTQRF